MGKKNPFFSSRWKKSDFGRFFFRGDDKKPTKTGKEYGIEWNKNAFKGCSTVQGCFFQIDIITTRRKTPINLNKCKAKNVSAVQFKWNVLYLVYSPHFFDISPTVRYFFFLGSQKRRLQAELLHWWFDLHSVVIAANLKVIKTIKQTLHPSFELNQTIWHFNHSYLL